MPHYLDITLTDPQIKRLNELPSESWFSAVRFANASSPQHPNPSLEANHTLKMELLAQWIREHVEGKRVLDLFCANGTFSAEAAMNGASEIVGVDFSPERVECARFIGEVVAEQTGCKMMFQTGDVYELDRLFSEPFDVVMCFGGLYHIADPPYVLTKIRELVTETMIVQTSSILPGEGNRAKFIVRQDKTTDGMTSIRGGSGVWLVTASCFENMLTHGGFRVIESKRPQPEDRERFPWYAALTQPI